MNQDWSGEVQPWATRLERDSFPAPWRASVSHEYRKMTTLTDEPSARRAEGYGVSLSSAILLSDGSGIGDGASWVLASSSTETWSGPGRRTGYNTLITPQGSSRQKRHRMQRTFKFQIWSAYSWMVRSLLNFQLLLVLMIDILTHFCGIWYIASTRACASQYDGKSWHTK